MRWDCSERDAIDPPYLAPFGVMTGGRTAAMIAVTGGRTAAMIAATGGMTAAIAVEGLGCCAARSVPCSNLEACGSLAAVACDTR